MRALRTFLAVALILIGLVGFIVAIDQKSAYQRGHDVAVDSMSALVEVFADGVQVALDELVKCELSKPGHIVFPSDTAIRFTAK